MNIPTEIEATRMKGKFLSDLMPGGSFTGSVFIIRDVVLKKSTNGSYYLTCQLSDRTATVRAKMWNVTAEQSHLACTSQLIRAHGEMQNGDYIGEVVIKTFEPVDIPDDLGDFIAPLRANYEAQHDRFRKTIALVKEPNLRTLLEKVFDPGGTLWEPFYNAVAARSMHHAYRGGLLDHTLEVARLCHVTCHVLKSLRHDFLITCALLHDIGKLEEMDHGLAAGEYTAAGNLIGHTILGMQHVAAACDAIPGFPGELKHGIMHMILSHHGKPEFGAARMPSCAEAQVLAANDIVSARVDQCQTATDGAVEGKHSVSIYGWESKFVHVGDFGLEREMAVDID